MTPRINRAKLDCRHWFVRRTQQVSSESVVGQPSQHKEARSAGEERASIFAHRRQRIGIGLASPGMGIDYGAPWPLPTYRDF